MGPRLNENQLTATAHLHGPMMVLAGPGSGKTAVITARAAHMVQQHGVPAQHILVIAYSRAAANEMQRRFAQRFESQNLPVPPVTFGTFHSVFFRMLRRHRNTDPQLLAEGERRAVVRRYLADMDYDTDEEFLSGVLGEMSLVRNELYDPAHYHANNLGSDAFRGLCAAYAAYKDEHNKIDFDDMLCHTYEMFQENEQILNHWRSRFPYIMVDEFQDINHVQYETLRLLAAPTHHLLVVGDDDQSIYRFRGSRPEFLLNFPQHFPGAAQVTLNTNYRSTDTIIKYANAAIAPNRHRYNKGIIGTGRPGPAPTWVKCADINQEATRTAEKIRDMQRKGADLNEIAVLFRLNLQARALADAFLHHNIPFRSRDDMPVLYEHWIAQDIYAYLRVAHRLHTDPHTGYDPDTARIINKPFRYISQAFLQAQQKANRNIFTAYHRDPTLHMAQRTRMEETHIQLQTLAKKNTADAIRYIRRQIGYNGHIHDHCEYHRTSPTGLLEILGELQEAAKAHPRPADFLAYAQHRIDNKHDTQAQGPCVTLSTLHSAKGLEFERVFIVGCVEEVLPHIRSTTPEEIEEERRMFYVGITRAKTELYISTIKTRYDKPVAVSRFIKP